MRVVSLLPSATELLFAVGAGDEVVAVTHECDHPPGARRLPTITANRIDHDGRPPELIDRHIKAARHQGSSIYALDEAMLRALQPDLVVTQELCDVCAVAYRDVARAVRRIDADVDVLSLEPAGLDDIVATVITVAEATGHAAAGARLARQLAARIAAVEALPAAADPGALVCLEWTDPLMAGGHWVPEMVRRAGAVDPLGREGNPSQYVEWEAVCAAAPETMVLMPCGFDLERTLELAVEVTGRPGFDALPCARSGRVVAVDGSSYFNRPGPRIVEGLEMLAAIVRTDAGSVLPPGAAWVQTGQRTALA